MKNLLLNSCTIALLMVGCGRATAPPSAKPLAPVIRALSLTTDTSAPAPRVVASPPQVAVSVSAASAYKAWDDVGDLESPMKGIRREFKILQRASKDAAFAAAHESAHEIENRMTDLVARAAVFKGETPDEFRKFASATLAAARTVSRTAAANDDAGLDTAIQELDRSCKNCHDVYKEEY